MKTTGMEKQKLNLLKLGYWGRVFKTWKGIDFKCQSDPILIKTHAHKQEHTPKWVRDQ